jgi:8-oxo-dGTP diphosphatase
MPQINVVSAIIIQDGKILATQRGYGDYKGWWEFPGGKIEVGESPEEALIREIREELEVEITIERFFDTTEYDYEKFFLSMRCYLCTFPPCQEISLTEHMSSVWVGEEDIEKLKWLAADLPIVQGLLSQGLLN